VDIVDGKAFILSSTKPANCLCFVVPNILTNLEKATP
jgi:hypothetical protein